MAESPDPKRITAIVAIARQTLKLTHPNAPYDRALVAEAVIASTASIPNVTDDERRAAIAEIEACEQVSIGKSTRISDDTGHVPWYFGQRRLESRAFFSRYAEYLEQEQKWGRRQIQALDECTDMVMEALEDPRREGPWDRRGLVLGHVQSGKTANYAGLLCKAADAGYRMLVVMAGMHNVLRLQTQLRLDRDFLGFKTTTLGGGQGLEWTGVGLIDRRPRADFLTTRKSNGDFNRTQATQAGITPGTHPLLLVIKKNASILGNLNAWVADFLASRGGTQTMPLIVVDDEADQASIDTGLQDFDNGVPDPDYEPKRINAEIRKLLKTFSRSAYVAYTATPFANILVHDQAETAALGPDLFPRSFIVNLPRPSNYVGPCEVFGIEPAGATSEPLHILDAFREVDQDKEGWAPRDHDRTLLPVYGGATRIPPSLEEAIRAFVLVCAARRARGQVDRHNSMLVHVSRFKDVHKEVHAQVDAWFTSFRRELRYRPDSVEPVLQALWEDDFVPSSAASQENGFDADLPLPTWEAVRSQLAEAADRIRTVVVNSDSIEPLDYEAYGESGLNVIAVGGDKLSRGLTLEGLSVSYFLRSSRMYDSLMQMGRWFGYRPGYVDLCRLYTTADLRLHYRHVATAAEELRVELDHMRALGETPERYGLKIQSHESLLVTARNKMQHTRDYLVSFAGQGKIQTVFETDRDVVLGNYERVRDFLASIACPYVDGPSIDMPDGKPVSWPNRRVWRDVPGPDVSRLLLSMRFPPESYEVSGERMADYINAQVREGELTNWTVALMMNGDGSPMKVGEWHCHTSVRNPVSRTGGNARAERYVVGTLLDPRDEAIDLSRDQYQVALDLTNVDRINEGKDRTDRPSGVRIRQVRGLDIAEHSSRGDPRRGLLLLYPLDPSKAVPKVEVDVPIFGVVVSFPASLTAKAVRYRYNTVLEKMEIV